LNDEDKLEITIERFGRERTPVLVVDNVLANAEEVREYSLGYNFARPLLGRAYYPGLRSACALRGVHAVGAWSARAMWTKGYGLDPEERVSMLGGVYTENLFCVFSPSKTFKYGNVHTDGHSWLAQLIYLTPGEERFSGTGFWRHGPTGLESVCSREKPLPLMRQLDAMFKTRLLEGSRIVRDLYPDMTYNGWVQSLFRDLAMLPPFPAHDHGPWENIGVIPAKFNRLVVYPTWQFHSVVMKGEKPTISRENVRLTLNTFIKHPVLEPYPQMPLAALEGLELERPQHRAGAAAPRQV
jgi:hypothetical protein